MKLLLICVKEGKIAHSEPSEAQEAEEGFDKEKWLAQRKVKDPFEDVLKPLAKDKGSILQKIILLHISSS